MPDAPMNHVKNFTVEHPSASALKYFSKAHDAVAITIPLSKNHILTGNSSVYFTKLAFDSQIFGLSYLFAIGIPSLSGAEWTETRANRHAKRYFKRFGVDWTLYLKKYPLN